MSGSIVQCLKCGAWNWAGVKECTNCGSDELTLSLDQVYYAMFGKHIHQEGKIK